jgi:RimJ/RimL family protein N-acetyltransferase
LIIREFTLDDAAELHEIMRKPEVMYAWEHGFTVQQTRDWIKKQIKRYKEDGYGYFAVIREVDGKLIGQAGIMDSDIDGEPITEIGYIFDNEVRGNGYATEAAEALIELAFDQYGVDCLYCTIRPDNAASIRVAVRLGFNQTGEYTKTYQGQEMGHLLYTLTCQEG